MDAARLPAHPDPGGGRLHRGRGGEVRLAGELADLGIVDEQDVHALEQAGEVGQAGIILCLVYPLSRIQRSPQQALVARLGYATTFSLAMYWLGARG